MKHVHAVLDLLDLKSRGRGHYRGPAVRHHAAAARLYGGHLVAQALRSAALSLPEDRRPHSLHAYFLQPGDFSTSIDYTVDFRRDGGAFSVRHVVGSQAGRTLIEMQVSASIPFDDPVTHSTPPTSPPPGGLTTVQERLSDFTGELDGWWVRDRPFELRYVTPPPRLAAESSPSGERTSQLWVRAIR
jgi:acyl-CoA thioesterase-2